MYLVIVIVILMTLKLHKHNNMRRTYKGKIIHFMESTTQKKLMRKIEQHIWEIKIIGKVDFLNV